MLEREILSGNDDFEEMEELAESVDASRKAYKEAQELYEEENYSQAREKYLQVVEADRNYDVAQDAVSDCDRKIQEMIDIDRSVFFGESYDF